MRSVDARLRGSLERFGASVADVRKSQGFSQMDLAERAGLHANTVANIERGDVDASMLAVNLVLLELGCEGVLIAGDDFEPIFRAGIRPGSPFPELSSNGAAMAAIMGDAIRQRRLKLGLTIEETAAGAGVHRNTLWNLERGLVAPSICTTYRIFRSLRVSSVMGSNEGLVLR